MQALYKHLVHRVGEQSRLGEISGNRNVGNINMNMTCYRSLFTSIEQLQGHIQPVITKSEATRVVFYNIIFW